ncbi:SLC13 family permease [Halococcus sp. IIIV-5B]|uniref:SLC13 family permease n=1 Tax=Halococcus sp. IIIV-5B TaxID=2321230 RepID=UPI000E746E50|nr:SLC13 family permease [Halococcus sp. IIIV-5B]RJT07070.1 SLC13 family permease [Halococcus sp. IIIV-5B]
MTAIILQSANAIPPVTPNMLVVFLVIIAAIILFVTEWLPIDVTAIAIMVALIVLEPWTQISADEGISGFASSATITVLAMLILSAGISQTGVVQLVGQRISNFAGENLQRQLLATVGVTGPVSGFINNTPVVAILVPVISDVAHKGKTSPSKLLIPLSYASQLGGMLTLIGTSTNILASDTAGSLSSEYPALHAFSFFEFTQLGVVVLLVGGLYLLFIGHRLLPERVPPEEDYVEEYAIQNYLSELVVRSDSPLIGMTVEEADGETESGTNILQLIRNGEQFTEPLAQKEIRDGDILLVRASGEALRQFAEAESLAIENSLETDEELEPGDQDEQTIVEMVIPSSSRLVGETLTSSTFRQRYDANVLAFRSHGEVVRDRLQDITIRGGDTLLIQADSNSIDRLARNNDFILAHEADEPNYRTEKIPHAIAIMFGVVGLVAIPWPALGNGLASLTGVQLLSLLGGLQQDILVTSLAGVVAMVVAGVLRPGEIYDSVDWNVIFLLAGVIPLGVALQQTGAAMFLGRVVAASADFLPVLLVLWLFYIATGLITEVISNNASVVLMIPVAAAAATAIDANPFAFVLAVTFAASTAFLGPIGYQTNLFVYGPGGYKFSDYFRIGAPLQILLSITTVLGIAFFWGV